MRETHFFRQRAQPVPQIKGPYLPVQPVVLKEMEESSRSRLIRLCSMHRENAAIRTLKCVGEFIAIAFLTTDYFGKWCYMLARGENIDNVMPRCDI